MNKSAGRLVLVVPLAIGGLPGYGDAAPPPRPAAVPSVPAAYYVAPDGDDSADGSAATPFATLARSVQAMASGPIKSTFVENGDYRLTNPVTIGQADQNEAIAAYPGHQPVVTSAAGRLPSLIVLHATRNVTIVGLTFRGAGAGGAIHMSGTTASRIAGNHLADNGNGIVLTAASKANSVTGNEIDGSQRSAVEVKDGSDANTFDSNLIVGTEAVGTAGGGFLLHGVADNVISHNQVEDTAGLGIGIENWNTATVNRGNVVEYNVVRHANHAPASIDSGAIYVLGRSQIDTHMVIRNNLIAGTGAPHPAHTVGIYLDDLSSGVMVLNNIITGVGSDAVQIHGGQNNLVLNNIIDTGRGRASAVLFQAAPRDTNPRIPMTNNVVTRNIIYSSSMKPVIFVNYDGGVPMIFTNLYYGSANAPAMVAALRGDLQPSFGDPGFANPGQGDYTPDAATAAASIGFQAIEQQRIGLTTAQLLQFGRGAINMPCDQRRSEAPSSQ